MQRSHVGEQRFFLGQAFLLTFGFHRCHLFDHFLHLGEEFMQRWIDKPDDHRQSGHGLEESVEVLALVRQQFVKCLNALLRIVSQDHALNDWQPLLLEEHVLGAA